MKTETGVLVAALRILANDIEAPDDALREAADRLEELDDALADARLQMKGMAEAGELQGAEKELREARK
jgi:hypothetical protein